MILLSLIMTGIAWFMGYTAGRDDGYIKGLEESVIKLKENK